MAGFSLSQLQKKYLGGIVPVINIRGTINRNTASQVQQKLKKITLGRAVALAVSVTSPGGLPVQSHIIANKILNFANSHNLKLYTFAKQSVLGSAYMILSVGHHVSADRSSIIGNLNTNFKKYELEGLISSLSIQRKSITTQKNLLNDILDPLQSISTQEKLYLQQLCEGTHSNFIKFIKNNRKNKINEQQIPQGDIFIAEKAKGHGLIDQIGSMVEILQSKYPEMQIKIQQHKKSFLSQIGLI